MRNEIGGNGLFENGMKSLLSSARQQRSCDDIVWHIVARVWRGEVMRMYISCSSFFMYCCDCILAVRLKRQSTRSNYTYDIFVYISVVHIPQLHNTLSSVRFRSPAWDDMAKSQSNLTQAPIGIAHVGRSPLSVVVVLSFRVCLWFFCGLKLWSLCGTILVLIFLKCDAMSCGPGVACFKHPIHTNNQTFVFCVLTFVRFFCAFAAHQWLPPAARQRLSSWAVLFLLQPQRAPPSTIVRFSLSCIMGRCVAI